MIQAMKVTKLVTVEVDGLGEMIKQARKASPKAVRDLAKEAGISTVHWYDIEGDKLRSSLPEPTLRNIEKALGTDFGINFD